MPLWKERMKCSADEQNCQRGCKPHPPHPGTIRGDGDKGANSYTWGHHEGLTSERVEIMPGGELWRCDLRCGCRGLQFHRGRRWQMRDRERTLNAPSRQSRHPNRVGDSEANLDVHQSKFTARRVEVKGIEDPIQRCLGETPDTSFPPRLSSRTRLL